MLLKRDRRLPKDFESLAETLATFVTLASIQLALRRLARAWPLTSTIPSRDNGAAPAAGGERLLSNRSADFRRASSSDADAPKHKVAALQPATRGKRREAGSQLRGRP